MAAKASLKEYERKRDFKKTPEPKGKKPKSKGKALSFVIQKHDASRLHYDFRLEVDGVLKSWAVPKGPSLNPDEKHLAIEVEDHPLDYGGFEGTIPKGQYGGGTVMLWDRGTYRNIMAEKDDPLSMQESIDKGHVEVFVEGEKIKGAFVLIRIKSGEKNQWLLKKMKDEFADKRRKPTSTQNNSVTTGRTMEQIAKEEGGEADDPG